MACEVSTECSPATPPARPAHAHCCREPEEGEVRDEHGGSWGAGDRDRRRRSRSRSRDRSRCGIIISRPLAHRSSCVEGGTAFRCPRLCSPAWPYLAAHDAARPALLLPGGTTIAASGGTTIDTTGTGGMTIDLAAATAGGTEATTATDLHCARLERHHLPVVASGRGTCEPAVYRHRALQWSPRSSDLHPTLSNPFCRVVRPCIHLLRRPHVISYSQKKLGQSS